MFGSLAIQVSGDVPKYRLPDDLPLPKGFREEFNAWAAEYLGVTNICRDGEVYRYWTGGVPGQGREVILMNPRTYDKLQKELGYVPPTQAR